MCVLMTVDVHTIHSPRDLRLLDESSLAMHMTLLFLSLTLPGEPCTQQVLERCTRCAAEVLLQTAQQVAVRAQQCRAPLMLRTLLARRCCAWTGRSLECASHTGRPALLS